MEVKSEHILMNYFSFGIKSIITTDSLDYKIREKINVFANIFVDSAKYNF